MRKETYKREYWENRPIKESIHEKRDLWKRECMRKETYERENAWEKRPIKESIHAKKDL